MKLQVLILCCGKKTKNAGKKTPIVKNSIKFDEANNANKMKEFETQVKNFQKSQTEANRENKKRNQGNT